jgi:putative ABC transport system permease protein
VLLGFIVGAAVTAQTFYLFVIENLRQFGALKAIGATNRQIGTMVMLQALWLARWATASALADRRCSSPS